MKKLVLFVMAVMAFTGMSVAQDVYSVGYYTESGNSTTTAAVYKNGTELHNVWGSSYNRSSSDLLVHDNSCYWVINATSPGSNNYVKAEVWKDNEVYLDLTPVSGAHLNALCTGVNGGTNNLYSVGCMTYQGSMTAVAWKNDNSEPLYQLGTTFYNSEALGCCFSPDGHLYTCGYQYTDASGTTFHGVVWIDNNTYFNFPDNSTISDVAFWNDEVYSVGQIYEDGKYKLRVWRGMDELYTLLTQDVLFTLSRTKIFTDGTGDIYVCGYAGGDDKVWKNGNECFTTPGFTTDVMSNSDGVYWTGSRGGVAKIWKDGSELYSSEGCVRFTGIYIEEPECTSNEARPLPYFEGFETGNTDWACWYSEDTDGSNDNYDSYWHRVGERMPYIYAANGDYCAMHYYGPEDVEQEGWLSSPLIGIPADGGNVKMTFNTAEYYTDDYEYEGVWVASESIPDGVELWVAPSDFVSDEWKTVELDLSAYKGMDIRVYFKYVGTYAHFWYVDDVSIEQEAAPATYTITTDVNPAGAGTVDGGGTYPAGTEVTLTATANTGYTFSHWQDGITANPRTITVNGNETYTAYFTTGGGVTMYTVTVVSENPLLGTVTGGGTYPSGAVIQISATPSPQARFVSWNDGNTDNPRNITVTGDVTYTAKFEALQNYTITVVSANPAMGTAEGGGTFLEGTVINISATPLAGYYFIGWNDGNADNPRSITVTANETYVAQFGTNPVQTYTLTVMCNSSEGSTIGSGTYTAGSTTTIAAIPNSGYLFDKWQDNVTENPRQVIVNSDMTFVAFFKGTGVNENEGHLMVLYPNPANDYVRLEGIEANSEVRIYNAMGALVKVLNANPNEEIGISELSDGLYVLRCGNATLRFVKK